MLASSIPFILPPLSTSERLENISIQSASGNNINKSPLPSFVRPFRAPHHSITAMGLIGGGNSLLPGEITLAHNGVLYLDEMSEFPRYQLELLRQPIEERKITLSRGHHHIIFPARFMLVGSMNPCPCGYHGFDNKSHKCTCNSASLEKFRKKISGPIFDRFDLQLEIARIENFDSLNPSEQRTDEDSSSVSRRVLKAVQQQELRFNNTNRRNADMNPSEIERFCHLSKGCKALLRESYERFDMSHRMFHRFIKLARTISDLNEREMISETDLLEAIYFRTMEKNFS
jgi:magnesium chelatase family protein